MGHWESSGCVFTVIGRTNLVAGRGEVVYRIVEKGVRICLGDTATAKCLYQGGTPGTGGDEGEKSSVDFGERVCGGEGIVRKPAGGAQGG